MLSAQWPALLPRLALVVAALAAARRWKRVSLPGEDLSQSATLVSMLARQCERSTPTAQHSAWRTCDGSNLNLLQPFCARRHVRTVWVRPALGTGYGFRLCVAHLGQAVELHEERLR